jgi:hypothetical protein
MTHRIVMAGLILAIHAFDAAKARMPGARPGVTVAASN